MTEQAEGIRLYPNARDLRGGRNVIPDVVTMENAMYLRAFMDGKKWEWRTLIRAVEILEKLRGK